MAVVVKETNCMDEELGLSWVLLIRKEEEELSYSYGHLVMLASRKLGDLGDLLSPDLT